MAAKTTPKRRVYCDARCLLGHVDTHLKRKRLPDAGRTLLEATRRILYSHCVYYRTFPKQASNLRHMVRELNKCGAFESDGMARLIYAIIQTGEACLRGEGNTKHVASALVLTHAICNGSTKELCQPARGRSASGNLFVQPKAGGRV